MKVSKSIIITVLIGSFVLLMAGVLVFAYFAYFDEIDNDMTVAHNTVEVSEVFDPPSEQTTGDNIFKKEVTVKNTGGSPCYIRVYVDFSDNFVRSRSFISDGTNPDDLTFYSAERIIDSSDDIVTFIEHVNSGSDWKFVPDNSGTVLSGYYYYKQPVGTGEATPLLMTYVKTVNPTQDDIDQYDIFVYSESTQITDMNGDEYADWEAAWTDYLSR